MARTTPPPCGIYSNHVQTCRLIGSGLSHGHFCLDFILGHTNNGYFPGLCKTYNKPRISGLKLKGKILYKVKIGNYRLRIFLTR